MGRCNVSRKGDRSYSETVRTRSDRTIIILVPDVRHIITGIVKEAVGTRSEQASGM